ncbi:MAG: hypothetical protein AAGC93_22790, partial [Cyanobacteria bacterium P01_F01_bin.53]
MIIGILGAFALNNWNEERKARNQLNNTLLEVYENLNADIEILARAIEDADTLIFRLQYLEDHGLEIPMDTLVELITRMHRVTEWSPITIGYDKLTNSQGGNRLPKELNYDISSAYNVFLQTTNQNSAQDLSLYSLNNYRSYLIDLGFPLNQYKYGVRSPKNKEIVITAMEDIRFIGIIRNFQYSIGGQREGYRWSKNRIEDICKKLERYFAEKNIYFSK